MIHRFFVKSAECRCVPFTVLDYCLTINNAEIDAPQRNFDENDTRKETKRMCGSQLDRYMMQQANNTKHTAGDAMK